MGFLLVAYYLHFIFLLYFCCSPLLAVGCWVIGFDLLDVSGNGRYLLLVVICCLLIVGCCCRWLLLVSVLGCWLMISVPGFLYRLFSS
jgi:hypothetical protein